MKKLQSSFINMVLVLTIITLIAAGALGALYTVTSEPIRLANIAKQEAAIKDVLPTYDNLDEAVQVNDLNIYRAYNGDEFVGAAVEAISNKGFGGDIRVMIGFDKEGNIINYSVLDQKETPGLGTKMVDWFKSDNAKRSVIGRNPATDNLTVSKDGGNVDAITAATISSRAFLDAVALAYAAYSTSNAELAPMEATSGATTQIASTDSIIVETNDTIYQQNN